MRKTLLSTALWLPLLAGCGASYDRELLGDPEPDFSGPAPASVPADATVSESAALADEPVYEEVQAPGLTPAGYEVFDDLKFWGSWYEVPIYGWVWRPMAFADWSPALYGRWVYTSYGWMWETDDPWGSIVYNYGYWEHDVMLGWVWIPSFEWFPCTFTWLMVNGAICWAPPPPPGRHWDDPWYAATDDCWVIVDEANFMDPNIERVRIPPAKFKSRYRTGDAVTRQPPDSRTIERRRGETLVIRDVRLEPIRIGDKTVNEVVFIGSPKQKRIAPMPPAVTPIVDSGSGDGQVKPAPAKTSDKKPAEKNSDPPRYKSKEGRDAGSKDKADTKEKQKDTGKDKDGDAKGKGKK